MTVKNEVAKKSVSTFQKVGVLVSKKFGRAALQIKKKSPELLMIGGITGIGVTIYLSCKATLELEEITDHADMEIHMLEEQIADEIIAPESRNKELTKIYARAGFDIARLYAPAAVIGTLSVSALVGSHYVMKQRNLAMAAAYSMMERGFSEYRSRVVAELGEEKDEQFRYGTTTESVTVHNTDENGKVTKKKQKIKRGPNEPSIYARYYDETSEQWNKTPEYSLIWLKAQQQHANDLLTVRGHVFLNEVYDMLGLERSQAGQVVGWVVSKDGDNYIDFGLYDIHSKEARDFVNGYEPSILLDFNVDGIIYDKI